MAYTTDLVYAIYGKDKTASKTLKGVGKESKTLGEQFKHMGKVAAASFPVTIFYLPVRHSPPGCPALPFGTYTFLKFTIVSFVVINFSQTIES